MSSPFHIPGNTAYLDGPRRQVPGFHDLHRMMTMLLTERVPQHARVLVLGAGGGLELKTLADAQPDWSFDGVDPSADMLDLARQTVAEHHERIRFHEGTVHIAPEVLFDAATCLLTFHFITQDERRETLRQIRRRLKIGAPFILAHISFPQEEPERSLWIARHVTFSAQEGVSSAQLKKSQQAIKNHLTILDPKKEESMLQDAGFSGIRLFYAGLSFRGWLSYAA